jgi:hypothetical protein
MDSTKRDAAGVAAPSGVEDAKANWLRVNSSTGRYSWRKARGLLTVGDLTRRYLAGRHPVGPYFIALPEDVIGPREVPHA